MEILKLVGMLILTGLALYGLAFSLEKVRQVVLRPKDEEEEGD